MKFSYFVFMVLFIIIIVGGEGCRTEPDYQQMRSEILTLHKELIKAHLDKKVDFFVKDISDNYISVSRGDILKPTKEEIKSNFKRYLNHTNFTEYRDLQEPIIGFSGDGSVAWSVVQVKISGDRELEDGSIREFNSTWAWITLYEKQGDKWIRLMESSNSK